MSFLLFPPDEIELVRYLCIDLDLALLLSDVTDGGVPRIAPLPLAAVPDKLLWEPLPRAPGRPLSTPPDPLTFLFWCPSLGPVRTFVDAPEPTEAIDRVAAQLTREAKGPSYANAIDLTRTPVIRWQRARFQRACLQNGRRLVPGLLQAMPVKLRDTPPEVLKLHRKIERWLKKRGEKLNPFGHCSQTLVPQPRNLNPFWVWVHPHAMEWVRGGGEIWPWTA
jgi:hypothetical protein